MQVSYQYKLRPNDVQSAQMDEWINMLRSLYNWMLADRVDGYYQTFIMGDYCDVRTQAEISPLTCSLSKNTNLHNPWKKPDKEGKVKKRSARSMQDAYLPELKKARPWYGTIYSTVLQMLIKRLDAAYEGFFKHGRGFPRFQNRSTFRSFQYKPGDAKIDGNRIYLPSIGWMRFFNSRPIPLGFEIRTVTVRRKVDGWYVSILIRDDSVPQILTPKDVKTILGVDMGLTKLAHLSDGSDFDNPRPATSRKGKRFLKLRQRRVSRKKKGSQNRKKVNCLLPETSSHPAVRLWSPTREGRSCNAFLLYLKFYSNFRKGLFTTMPYASSSRYQSRLFNFVNQQSRRLGDRIQRTFRHLQVATSWSLEALLYPVYLLFQKAIESDERQLHSQKRQHQLKLQADRRNSQLETPPSVDTPIQRVLEAVEKQPDVVRGIASERESRNLVLVSDENEPLNILTLQQQEKLQDRIITEIAQYWRYWRLRAEQDETKLLTEIDCLLTKLTNGNVDKTPTLPEKTRVEDAIESTSLLYPYSALALLDAAVAKLESNALIPMSRATSLVQQRSAKLIHVVQTQLNIFVYGKEQLTKSVSTVDAPHGENQEIKIQALIWAAVNFFFGTRTAKKVKQSTTAQNISEIPGKRLPPRLPTPALPSQHLPSVELADPWLSESDLFGDSQQVRDQESGEFLPASQIKRSPVSPGLSARYSLKNLLNSYQKFFQQPESDAALARRKKLNRDLTPTQKIRAKITSTKQTAASISQFESESNKGEIFQQQHHRSSQVEAKPDWIETKARTMGYEKHPLEQILEWLDRAMLLLEEMVAKFFQFLQRLWSGK